MVCAIFFHFISRVLRTLHDSKTTFSFLQLQYSSLFCHWVLVFKTFFLRSQYFCFQKESKMLERFMGRQVSSKMCTCFLCIMRRQFEDLFICEKRHPKSAKKSTLKNWHLKCAKRGSVYVQKNYAQKLAP